MEIPDISMITDFQGGMKCLQNPSVISRFLSDSNLGKVPPVDSFWKWGALILALVATVTGVVNRVAKILIVRLRDVKSLAASSSEPLLQYFHEWDCDLTDDDTTSSLASDDEECELSSPPEDPRSVDEDLRVAGSSCFGGDGWENGNFELRLRKTSTGNRSSWSSFAAGQNVVKLWDSLGLASNFEDLFSSRSVVSSWDIDRDEAVSSLFGGLHQIPAVTMLSPELSVSAKVAGGDGVVVSAYDRRMTREVPAMYAEWWPQQSNVLSIAHGGVGKLYVRDGVTGTLTVRDVRNVKRPLDNATESEVDTWWDADAVIVSNEFVDES